MMHGLKALRSCENEIELTIKNVSLAIVGKDTDFTFVTPDDLQAYLGEIAPVNLYYLFDFVNYYKARSRRRRR